MMKACKAVLAIGLFVLVGLDTLGAQEAGGTRAGRFSRFHLRAGTSFLSAGLTPTLSGDLSVWGFGDAWKGYVFLFGYVTDEYPKGSRQRPYDFALDYSITKDFNVGFSVCSLGKATSKGRDQIGPTYEEGLTMEVMVDAAVRGWAYFLNASYAPQPKPGRWVSMRAGLGVGIGDVQASLTTNAESRIFRGHPLCGRLYAGVDFWPFELISFGLIVEYHYVPNFPGAFEIAGRYYDFTIDQNVTHTYHIPASNFGLGGESVSLSVGLHL